MVADTDAMRWRFLALVAHMMRPAAPDARSNMALNRYLPRHPFR